MPCAGYDQGLEPMTDAVDNNTIALAILAVGIVAVWFFRVD